MRRLTFEGIKTHQGDDGLYKIQQNTKQRREEGFYFLSNDVIHFKIKKHFHNKGVVFIGIANPHFFHALYETISNSIEIVRIIAVDNSFLQLVHFNRLRNLVLISNNRIEYIQNLFKIKLNQRSVTLLDNIKLKSPQVTGGTQQDNLYLAEKKLWENVTFNQKRFYAEYGLKAEKESNGLKIQSRTIGDIETYYATVITGSKSNYSHWPFTAAYGTGFLKSEQTFKQLKSVLKKRPTYQICDDIASIYETLLLSNRYKPIIFWSSNILCDYFINKHRNLNDIICLSTHYGTQTDPDLPEIDLVILQDDRTKATLPKAIDNHWYHKRKWGIHTKSFNKVGKYLHGTRNLEIVNVNRWIDNDSGISKLPNTEYMMANDFLRLEMDKAFDSIFLHILAGHGLPMDQYKKLILKAFRQTKNLIILEHNQDSRDFKYSRIGLPVGFFRDLVGKESFIEYCPGAKCNNRNILLIYRNTDEDRLFNT